tara:strand:+ start:8730 stop:10109 length:1380 start_codon:yes stop_codon:yes gene_type:complete
MAFFPNFTTDLPPAEAPMSNAPLGLAAIDRSFNIANRVNRDIPVDDAPNLRGMSRQGNLASLFGNLNRISATSIEQARGMKGPGGGGGSAQVEGNMDANPLIALNPYMGENVTSFNKGGMYDVPEYGLGGFLRSVFKPVTSAVKAVTQPLNTVLNPVFDVAGNVVDPLAQASTNVVRTVGDKALTPAVKTIASGSRGLVEGTGKVATTAMKEANKVIKPVLEPGMDLAMDVATPILRGVRNVTEPIMGAGLNLAGGLIEGALDATKSLGFGAIDLLNEYVRPVLFPSRDSYNFNMPQDNLQTVKRDPIQKAAEPVMSGLNVRKADVLSNIKKSSDPAGLLEGDWVGEKENPFVTPNVEEELDYAKHGMKMPDYNHGGYYTQQANQAIAMNQLSGLVSNAMNKGAMSMAKGGAFKPHMMYDPKTGKAYKANKLQDHLDMKEKGYDHRKRNPKNYLNGGRF